MTMTASPLCWRSLLVLLCAMHNGAALAASPPDCSRPLTLALHENGLLYSKTADQGIDKDVAREMIRRSGCKVEVSVMPRARIWAWIESGQLDFSMSGTTNEERDRYADFAWYLYNKDYLLVRKDANVNSLAEFENNPKLVIGTIRGFRYSKNANWLVSLLTTQKRIIEVPDHAQLLNMIKLNRIQGMIIEPFNYRQVDSRSYQDITRILDMRDAPVLHGVIMSKKSLSAVERDKWKAVIEGMRKDGTLLKILRKYFDEGTAKSMVDF